jgi:uncharacterized protein YqgV (UPF0045/DUF77 family)
MTTTQTTIQTAIEELCDWQAELESGPHHESLESEWAETLDKVSAANKALIDLREFCKLYD